MGDRISTHTSTPVHWQRIRTHVSTPVRRQSAPQHEILSKCVWFVVCGAGGVWGSGWKGRGEEVLEFVLSPLRSVHKHTSRKPENVTHLADDFPRGRTVLVVLQLCCVHVPQGMTRPRLLPGHTAPWQDSESHQDQPSKDDFTDVLKLPAWKHHSQRTGSSIDSTPLEVYFQLLKVWLHSPGEKKKKNAAITPTH